MKFSVGDEVVCIKSSALDYWRGAGTITNLHKDLSLYNVKFPDATGADKTGAFTPDQLRIATKLEKVLL